MYKPDIKQGYNPKWGNYFLISFDGKTFQSFKKSATGLHYEGDANTAFPGLLQHLNELDELLNKTRRSFEVKSPEEGILCVT